MAQVLVPLFLSYPCDIYGVLASPLLGMVGRICPQLGLEEAPCRGR